VKQEVKHVEVTVKNEDGESAETAEAPTKKPRKEKPRDPKLPPLYEFPTEAVLADAEMMVPGPRPVPNLGFACLNATLRAQRPAKHAIFSNRDCIKRTYDAKGLPYISELALANCRDLAALVRWNHEHGIRFFRMSSKILPWCTEYDFDQLPDKEAIAKELAFVGRLARAYDQRLTFHPTHFVKLGCQESPLLQRSLKELEQHSLWC
jgi:UV DNA damage endonuclease